MDELLHEQTVVPDHADKVSISESECSTTFTPSITSDATIPTPKHISSIPWPGSTYIIRSVSTGKVITFRGGKIVLGPIDGYAIRWECVEKIGWLGFRDPASYKFLGYDINGELLCRQDEQGGWENFCVRLRPNGTFSMLMYQYGSVPLPWWQAFCPVGIKTEDGCEKLAVIQDWESETTEWEFIKVEPK